MNPYVANSRAVVRNTLDRATERLVTASKRRLAWGGLALAALTFLSFNLLSQTWFRGWKADVTKENLYTISPGTMKALAAIDEPIDLQVYFSKKLGEAAPQYAKSFERVRTLLEQYRAISGNRLRVTYYDPEPFSDAEDRATAAGLRGQPMNQNGDLAYFGIAGTNSTDTEANIAFFAADRERFVEYDVTKLVYSLANPKKKAIGLLSTVPLEGGMDPTMGMRGRPTPPQMILEQIREVFEIKTVARDATDIGRDIDVLMLVQPDALSPQTAYAIDQFVLRGGKLLAFIDPVTETVRPQGGPMMMMGPQPPNLAEMDKLLKAWGVTFDPTKVATDIAHARRVQFGGARGNVTEYIAWLGLDKRNLDAKDVLSASVEKLNVGTAGSFAKADGASTAFGPLLTTSPRAMQIAAERVTMMPDAVGLLRGYKAEGKPLVLAARVSGDIKSAYPGGAPKEPVKPDDKKDAATPADAAKNDPQKKDDKAAGSHLAAGKLNAILIADSDILNDQFWVDVREFLGQQVATPTAHNATFVLAALENLSGSEALLSLRGRGITDRPFDKVNDIRRDSEQRFREKEQGLTAKLKGLQDDLSKVERQTVNGEVVLSDKDRAAIEKFRGDMTSTRRELRDVKLALRQDIDRLDRWLQFVNIAFVPLLIGLAGLWYASRRRRPAAL